MCGDATTNVGLDINDDPTHWNGDDNLQGSPGVSPSGKTAVVVAGGPDANIAEQQYSVTARQPGNNWRVVAHAVEDAPDQVEIDTGPIRRGLDFQLSPGGGTLEAQYRTPLLFVWRTLHIELDSMGSETDGGTSTGLTVDTLTDSAKAWATNQFASYGENWQLNPNTGQAVTFPVVANTGTVITATTQPAQNLLTVGNVGDPYQVAYAGWPPTPTDPDCCDELRGDIPEPLTEALDGAFRPCYVEPAPFVDNSVTPWHHKFGFSWVAEQAYLLAERGIAIGDSDYWGAYACGNYDTVIQDVDNDPDTELGVPAFAYSADVIAIWFEVSRDMGAQWSWSPEQLEHMRDGDLPHELGHWFDLPHYSTPDSDNVMWVAGGDSEEPVYTTLPLVFRPRDQRLIRDSLRPGVH
jgi:hypothetical protein